jgi:hypothetical protein
MTDLRNDWRGRVWSIRQMPRHWHIETPTDWVDVVRAIAWTTVKTVAFAAAIVLLLSLARGA